MPQEEVLRGKLLRALEGIPIQFSLMVKIDPQEFSEGDIVPLVDFVNEKVGEVKQEDLPAKLRFGSAEILLRRYTIDVSPSPRIMVVTE